MWEVEYEGLQELAMRVVQGFQPPDYPVELVGQVWRQEKGHAEAGGCAD